MVLRWICGLLGRFYPSIKYKSCVFAELLTQKPLFPGKSELDQLEWIFRVCGTPSTSDWTELEQLPFFNTFQESFKKKGNSKLKELFQK